MQQRQCEGHSVAEISGMMLLSLCWHDAAIIVLDQTQPDRSPAVVVWYDTYCCENHYGMRESVCINTGTAARLNQRALSRASALP